jgi:hypothetical protein
LNYKKIKEKQEKESVNKKKKLNHLPKKKAKTNSNPFPPSICCPQKQQAETDRREDNCRN